MKAGAIGAPQAKPEEEEWLAKMRDWSLSSKKVFWQGADGARKLQKVTLKKPLTATAL